MTANRAQPSVQPTSLAPEAYAEAFRSAGVPFLLLDPTSGRIVDANDAASAFYGWPVDTLRGMSIAEINPLPRERIRDELGRVLERPHARFLFPHRLAGGEVREVEVDAYPLDMDGRRLLGLLVHDVSEDATRLRGAIGAQRILLREIHHRVKNNLQVVSSLLSLQAGHAEDEGVRGLLLDTQSRVRALALVHELLHPVEPAAGPDLRAYLEALVGQLVRVYGGAAGRVETRVEVEPVPLDPETANPLGLIVNELVTNVLKHAFPEGRPGRLEVALRRRGGTLTLSVTDDGVGLPPRLDLARTGTLGLGLVLALADQLAATVEIRRREGTCFVLHFPAPKDPDA